MLKGVSGAIAIALSFLALPGTADAMIGFPNQCWPDCQSWLENQQCQAWYGPLWYYCGWANGITYCCY